MRIPGFFFLRGRFTGRCRESVAELPSDRVSELPRSNGTTWHKLLPRPLPSVMIPSAFSIVIAPLDLLVLPDDGDRVELSTRDTEAPTACRSFSGCGTIVLWTRTPNAMPREKQP